MAIPPGWTQKDYDKRINDIKLCGRNMGPHDYIPVRWMIESEDSSESKLQTKEVTHFMCRICFAKVNMKTILKEFPDLSIKYPQMPDTSA